MTASTYPLTLTELTRPGYWLYVCSVITDKGKKFLYVGRTGDDKYTSAKPVIVRMGQHFDHKIKSSLHNKLLEKGVCPRLCTDYGVVVHGPLFPPPDDDDEYHAAQLVVVRPLERALRDALVHNGYDVLGRHPTDRNFCHRCWKDVRRGFGKHFELTNEYPPHNQRRDHPCSQHA